MSRRTGILIAAASLLAACATTDPGWTGSGAQPFDQALSQCRAQVATVTGEQERQIALYHCMAEKGWRRR